MDFTRLNKQIDDYCEKECIMGVLRVTVHDQIIYKREFGVADIETGERFSDTSAFTFYSISKPLCMLGIMKLVDAGLVDLDVHPSVYLPEAKWFDKRITLRMMFHHTSGLPELREIPDFLAKTAGEPYSLAARKGISMLADYPMHFEPGTRGEYANVNIMTAALIIENVTGIPYAKYMEKEVFTPLKMERTVVDDPVMFIPNRVSGHNLDSGKLVKVPKSYGSMFGAGDIVGTADDLYRLNHAIKYKLLISEDAWNAVLTPSPLSKMGLGCTITQWHGKHRITHNGGASGFRTLHVQLPDDDFDVIFLSNSGFGNARNDILEMIHDACYGSDQPLGDTFEMDKGYI